MLDKLFSLFLPIKHKKKVLNDTPPGRTFKRILTGEYFGYKENTNKNAQDFQIEKQNKIDQIKAHQLTPKYIRYSYQSSTNSSKNITQAYVSFQKEVLAKKWNMLHITEISFIIYAYDFQEFEKMAKVSLEKDFIVLESNSQNYQGKERRRKYRNSLI